MYQGHAVGWLRQSSEEQHSLDAQKQAFEKFVDANDFSRITILQHIGPASEENTIAFFRDAPAVYDEYEQLMTSGCVDVVWAIDKTRLGRGKGILGTMIQLPIKHGAKIYVPGVGEINNDNAEFHGALMSIGSKQDITRLLGPRAQETHMKRVGQGMPYKGHLPFTHDYIFDDKHDKIGVRVADEVRPFIRFVTDLLLSGHSYHTIAKKCNEMGYQHLKTRHGRKTAKNTIFRQNNIAYMLFNPISHGNSWVRFNKTTRGATVYGVWAFDPDSQDIPPDIDKIFWGVGEALWTGQVHEAVKHELRERKTRDLGAYNRHTSRNPFAGLLFCADCGRALRIHHVPNRPHAYYRCISSQTWYVDNCQNRDAFTLKSMQAQFDVILRQAINTGILTIQTQPNTQDQLSAWQHRKSQIESDIERIETTMSNLSLHMAQTPALVEANTRHILNLDKQKDQLHAELSNLINEKPIDTREQQKTIGQLREITLDGFWQLPIPEQNAILRKLIPTRIYMRGAAIVDIR